MCSSLTLSLICKIITERWLHWLGHAVHVNENRLPQIVLHGEMKKMRPPHGPKKCWKDLVSIDLQNINLSDTWQDLCLYRDKWYMCC